jgi:cardiolipin synthase
MCLGMATAEPLSTSNLDMRSLWLNYEVALFYLPVGVRRRLARLAANHSRSCWNPSPGRRPFRERLLENTLRLFSPLL